MEELLNELSVAEKIGFPLFGIALLIQLYYYFRYYFAVLFRNETKTIVSDKQPPATIVICARDEHQNLLKNLPAVLEQDYPEFQVVLVDDCSDDDTEDYLKQIKPQYPHLYVTRINPDPVFKHGKKLALTIGIKAAKHSHLLLTDADCIPASPLWLAEMMKGFTENTEIVIGYSPIKTEKGFLNHFLRYENLFTAMQYLGAAIRHKPYMGVGRNLAYTKEIFFRHKGFASHSHLLSGDDDLFVNKAATKRNTNVCFSANSIVETEAPDSWKSYMVRRKRQLTSGSLYKFSDKFRLGSELLSRFVFIVLFIVLLVISPYWYIALGAFVVRMIVQWLCINLTAKKLQQNVFHLSFLLYDILSPAINGLFSFSNLLRPKSIKWK